MAHAWLDSLSEDWVSQPRSDNSQAHLSILSNSQADSRQDSSRPPASMIPRPSPRAAKQSHPPSDALSQRSSNDINIQSPQRVSSKQSDNSRASQRGRHLSRSFSASTAGSVLHNTVQHKSLSASPGKQKGSVAEWRRRLLYGEGDYAGPTNLFSSAGAGLENMFRPLPPIDAPSLEPAHEGEHVAHDMTLPSSPPPYSRSRQQQRTNDSYEDSSWDFSEIPSSVPAGQNRRETKDAINADSTKTDDVDATVDYSGNAHEPVSQAQSETSYASMAAKLRFDASRKTSGKSDVRNEDFSPILITRHDKEDGRVSFAPMELSADSLRDRLNKLRQNQTSIGPEIVIQHVRESTTPPDGLDTTQTTQDYARQGAFLNLRRGGRSAEGSFRRRPLSPPLPTDSSEMLPESSLQASTPKQFPGTVRTTATATERTERTKSLSPDLPHISIPSPDKRPLHSQSTGGSPLKLFGPYDTFTNQTLMRRISQFEDPVTESPSLSPDESVQRPRTAPQLKSNDNHVDMTRSQGTKKQQVSRGHYEIFGAINNFGAGDLDEFVFSEEISLGPSERSEFFDKENIAPVRTASTQNRAVVFDVSQGSSSMEAEDLRLQRRRTRSSTNGSSSKYSTSGLRSRPSSSYNVGFGGHCVLATPNRDGSDGKRPRTSPCKDPTPKRRRTLHRSDIAYGIEERPAAIEAVQTIHYLMQSGIGRKRKDARQGEMLQLAHPAVMANRQVIRPRTPTPSQRSSIQRERETLTEIPMGSEHLSQDVSVSEGHSDAYAQESVIDGPRKISIKTQDFFVEAEKIMAMIRNKARPIPHNDLGSAEESEAEVSHRNKSDTPEEVNEDTYEESFEEPFSRPPSREGRPVLRLPPRQENQELADKLKMYEEHSDMGDIISYSMRSMGLAKEAIQEVNKINRSVAETLRLSETRHSNSEQADIISDLSNVRLSRNPDVSIYDETGPIPSHGSQSSNGSMGLSIPSVSSRGSESRRLIAPDAVSQLIGDHVGNMQLDKENKVWMKVKTPKPQPLGLSILASEDSEDDPFASIPDLSVDTHKEQEHLALRTTPLEDLQEYVKEDFPHPPSSGKKSSAADKSLDMDSILCHTKKTFENIKRTMAETVSKAEEEIEHEITLHEDRVLKSSPSRKRNLTITFSSPIASIIQDALPRQSEGDTTLEEISALESSIGDAIADSMKRGRAPRAQISVAKTAAPSRSRSRSKSGGRNLSVKGQAFVPRPVSRIDEQDEEATNDNSAVDQRQLSILGESSMVRQDDVEQRQNSVSFVVSTPALPRHISHNLATPMIADRVGTLSLSPLSEFTMNHGDRTNMLEVSYVVDDNYLVTGDRSKGVMSQAIRTLVEKITEAEPFEPDWDAIHVLNINGKQLKSLHKLDEFCSSVVTMDASDNLLGHLDGVPESVRNLRITNNQLSELTAWGHLMNLQYVDVSDNQITSLHAFQELVHLRSLRADNNQITSLDGIKFHDALQVLRLRNNLIDEVDLEGTQLHRLTELDLQGNRINNVENVELLPCLSTLNLENNCLASFATTKQGSISTIKYLKLSDNSITSLDLACFPALRLLHADRNQLACLKGFSRARRLDSLSLREQKGDEPLDMSFLTAAYEIRKLFLSGNLLTSFDPKVDFLNLQYLELANCGLQSLSENFGQLMPNLRTLNLDFNAVDDLSALRYIPRLKKLLVAGNRLSDTGALALLLAEFPHLSKLDLRDNPVTQGFYPPVQALVSMNCDSDFDAFVLPDASQERDAGFAKRLDMGTKQKRRFYEIAVAQRCSRLKILDGLSVDRQRIRKKDSVWKALLDCGAISEVAKEGNKEHDAGCVSDTPAKA